ncbi:MAG: TetR/AcrR family transcriptional regulator [Streptococcaceae bacterium]|jgi:AcrR family transcriptional regulator|nr:TetR/AcrR family transcriptional regulator [Streptococcaceae bacterium]
MVRKTEQKIIDAFLNLAASETTLTSEYGSISVKAIIEKANVSKPTFYSHFKNRNELIDTVKQNVFVPLFSMLDEHNSANTLSPFSPIINEVIPYLFKNRTIFCIFRNSSTDFNYQQSLENAFFCYFNRFLGTKQVLRGMDNTWLANYYAKVIVGILTTWLSDLFPEKPAQFKKKFYFLINTPLNTWGMSEIS